MRKVYKSFFILSILVFIFTTPLLAENEGKIDKTTLFKWSIIIGGGALGLAACVGAYAQSRAISKACDGISRNPGAASHIRFALIFGLVLIETLVIYVLLVAIIIFFVKWGKYI
ncbi:ATP synthase F0 subunit C [SCandidatus Aminicenantes bacterium Aminicenantia_JdfR_composite]|jgi:F-type H+-transporting ATPase subunit c|nr:ATP synthase F0 subunit C [SCandidatus Aminicenantes bacterium Aminicenantia_JdfR_composite]MCP2596858.1 ATP synthase F0 subunit C [Candidatus Aminicenantes bacterium AC-335-G13]MCP2598662.1 ATP synthase F0 subunit C [Candidatus Aminicenantes bacterium AC-335-L06]MCP2605530.1 ATP synthase F0 subunit C [Candidatus Aminicenantes bacterium AC-335-O07]MCP2606543.1 ATP synthase F0 subunit C [Candidatus Aminicenantes bacterium AC-708-I09]